MLLSRTASPSLHVIAERLKFKLVEWRWLTKEMGKIWFGDVFGNVPKPLLPLKKSHRNPTKHMPIGYWSLWGQPRSVTSGNLSWPWSSYDAISRVTSGHVLTPITSTIPIQVNRTTPICVFSRFRWNLGGSSYDVIYSWPDLPWLLFYQRLRQKCLISNVKIQRDTPNGVTSSSEKQKHQPPPLANVNIAENKRLCIFPVLGVQLHQEAKHQTL